jgi:DNA repair exonuclease SbcCD ATPase subunit
MEAAQTSRRSLGELFVERGLITEADLELALEEQAATKRRLADILVRRGLVTGHDITSALMEQLGSAAPAAAPAPADTPALEGTADVIALPQPSPEAAPEPEPALTVAEEPAPTPLPRPPIATQDPIAAADARCRSAEAGLNEARESHTRVLRELEEVRTELDAREAELARQVAIWQDARDEAESWGGRLAELHTRLEAADLELSEASATAAAWAVRASELGSDAEALADTVDSALHELDTLVAKRFPADGTDVPGEAEPVEDEAPARSLYFVPNEEGYDLIERDGEAPAVGETLDVGDRRFVVTKIGPSPLAFDPRSCIFLEAV